jgi:riboflavin synthase
MFTGLVEALGTIVAVAPEGAGKRLALRPPDPMFQGTALGESIAINGCCLTAVVAEQGRWEFQAGPETLSKTNLGGLAAGDRVNLERALSASGRLGGHFVQGHVDGCGTVERISSEGPWVFMWFRAPAELTSQMVPKGSVAVDGVSLTLVEVGSDHFSVALIPHTLEVTTLGTRRQGDRVNVETDVLAKYVAKLLQR